MASKTLFTLAVGLAFAGNSSAGVVTLNFSELPAQPVNGLAYSGVSFGFTCSSPCLSTDAKYNGALGSGTSLLNDPVLEGNSSGTLTLTFATPTPFLRFDVALGLLQSSSFAVQLSGSPSPTPTVAVPTTTPVLFSEGEFSYDNTKQGPAGALIKTAVITFPTGTRFGLDNLSFVAADVAVPEPGTSLMLGSALLAAVIGVRRRRA